MKVFAALKIKRSPCALVVGMVRVDQVGAVTVNIQSIDLLRLAKAEFVRYKEFAESGAYEQFASIKMARELVYEALDMLEIASTS